MVILQLNVRCFVSYLEKAVIETCRRYGIEAKTTENTGVWVGDNHKIAALGMFNSSASEDGYRDVKADCVCRCPIATIR
jgi:lipoate-protein ligase B